VKNCVYKNEIEPLLGTFAIDLSDAGEKTKQKVTVKMSKTLTKSPTKMFLGDNLKKASPFQKKETSKVIDIEMPQSMKRKVTSSIFAIQDPKYVEFVDEVDDKPKSKSNIFPTKLTKTMNLDPNPPSNRNLLNTPFSGNPPPPLKRSSISLILESEPIVIKANYVKEPNTSYAVEINIPNLKKYYPLGYDVPINRLDSTKTKKEYRLFLETILESSIYMDHHPFDEYIITRGNKAQSNSMMSKILGLDEGPRALGIFKCFVEVINEKDKNVLEMSRGKPLNDLFKKDSMNESMLSKSKTTKKLDLDKEFLQATNVVIRVHILEVYNLVQLDSDSIPNPYIAVSLGEQTKNVIN